MADAHIRALTARRRIKPTSLRCPSAWQPNPGRRSTYRCGDSVQTTGTTSNLHVQKYPRVAARQIAHPAHLAIVPAHLEATAAAASGFFERRLSVITPAFGSPNTPRTVCSGRKSGNEYVSHSRRVRLGPVRELLNRIGLAVCWGFRYEWGLYNLFA